MNLQDWIVSDEFAASVALKNHTYVCCIAEIRNNATGEVVEYETSQEVYPDDKTPSGYDWIDGNYACDCNRSLFWHRAKGLEEPEGLPCTDELFSVNLKNKKDGVIFYKEF